MTAKEIADKLMREHALDGDFKCLNDYKYLFEKIAKEYARQKCKEQRGLCWKESINHLDKYLDGAYGIMECAERKIRNAPEPKFD